MSAGLFVFIGQSESAGGVVNVDEVAGLQTGAFEDRFFAVQDAPGGQRNDGGQGQVILPRTVVIEGTDNGNVIMPDVVKGHDHQVCGSFSGGIPEYFLFTAGPVVIPAYVGFEAGIAVKTTLNVSFSMDKPPAGEASDTKWKYANNGSDDWSGRIEVILSFSVFGGVGVKGVLGACAIGYANMDIATVLGKGSASLVENPHTFIDILYGMRIEYYLLVYTGQINLNASRTPSGSTTATGTPPG